MIRDKFMPNNESWFCVASIKECPKIRPISYPSKYSIYGRKLTESYWNLFNHSYRVTSCKGPQDRCAHMQTDGISKSNFKKPVVPKAGACLL